MEDSPRKESLSDLREAAETALLKAIRIIASKAAADIAGPDAACTYADAALRLGEALESVDTWAS